MSLIQTLPKDYTEVNIERQNFTNLENRLAEILEGQNKFCSNLGRNI